MMDGMVTADTVRELALALPETEEKLAWGLPTFRVRGKIFCSLSDDDESMGFKVSKEERAELVAADPDKYFFIPSHDTNFNFARLRLAAVDADELREVITEAWRMTAPKRLARDHDAGT